MQSIGVLLGRSPYPILPSDRVGSRSVLPYPKVGSLCIFLSFRFRRRIKKRSEEKHRDKKGITEGLPKVIQPIQPIQPIQYEASPKAKGHRYKDIPKAGDMGIRVISPSLSLYLFALSDQENYPDTLCLPV